MKGIHRRTMLRGMLGGAGVCVALPTLDAMLDAHGEAYASGEPLPKRFGVFFWGNGVRLDAWVPDTTGPGWQPKELLQPFFAPETDVHDYVSVVSGTRCVSAGAGHHTGRAVMLAGSYDESLATYGRAYTPTSDQIAADSMQGDSPFRTLEIGVSRRGFENSTNERAMSWVDPTSALPAEHSPHQLFVRLFGDGVDEEEDFRLRDARGSVLDVVAQDAEVLSNKLGSADRIRLEAHLDGIRAIEKNLDFDTGGCVLPTDPGDFPDQDGKEQLAETSRAMSGLLAHALACDLTRVFTFKFTGMQTDTLFWQTGASEGLHTMTHDAGMQHMVHDAVRFMMQEWAYALAQLADMPEGTGNVLDNCAIYCTSELSEGESHSVQDMPILLCGKAGGALQSGIHYRSTTEENAVRALFTCLRACDVPVDEFGAGPDRADETLPALLT